MRESTALLSPLPSTSLVGMNSFSLHDRLARGSTDLGRYGSCRVLLKNHGPFPWILLVPEWPDAREIHDLPADVYAEVSRAIHRFSQWMSTWPGVEKVNVGAIGNQVPQLHIHIVGRHAQDPAWPGVVWAHAEKFPYPDAELAAHTARVRQWLTMP
jgi:diadenosine tetraphosphate (Ap4A) HIT family hydrolase